MKHLAWLAPCVALFLFSMGAVSAHDHDHADRGLSDTTVLIIRHAEKPDDGAGLTPAGQARAQAYVSYFENFSQNGQSLRPNALFAAADSKQSMRPRLTIEPLSHAMGLPIDDDFSDKQSKELVAALRSQSHGQVLLICWHHGEIPQLVHALGADAESVFPGDKWPPSVFGDVVVMRYDHTGQLIAGSLQIVPEKLMPDDH